MSELTSMVGVFLIVGCLALIVWLDYKGVSKAKNTLNMESTRILN